MSYNLLYSWRIGRFGSGLREKIIFFIVGHQDLLPSWALAPNSLFYLHKTDLNSNWFYFLCVIVCLPTFNFLFI